MTRRRTSDTLTSIVAIGELGEIGVNNSLPWRLKSDLRFFKQTTVGNVILLGRKTYDGIGCLKGRENIVLSHRASLFEAHEGCRHAHSVGEALFLRGKHASKHAFVIGGAITYKEFAPYVDRYLLTFVKARFPKADSHLDQAIFGNPDDWDMNEIEIERLSVPGSDDFDFSVVELTHKRAPEIAEARRQVVEIYQSRNHLLQRKEFRKRTAKAAQLDSEMLIA